MDEEVRDVSTAESSTASVKVESQPQDVTSESSTETAAPENKEFLDKFEKLETGKEPEEATVESAATTEAKPKDEGKAEVKATDAEALLKLQQDEALNKTFSERPEWKRAMLLVPKSQQASMAFLMRDIFRKEGEITKQVEQFKPVVQKFDRFKRSVGDDQAVENTIALTELFAAGDPKARAMLVTLLNDLDARTGGVLTSPDLKQRAADIDARLEKQIASVSDGYGNVDEKAASGFRDDAEAAKKDLLELEKSRVGQRQTEVQKRQAQQRQSQESFQKQQADMVTACNDWEKSMMASDPDYPSLKAVVESRAFLIGNEKQNKLQGRLLNATEMKSVLDEALTWAKAEAAKFAPRPQARTRLNGGGSSATSRREPANDDERFIQEMERRESRRR